MRLAVISDIHGNIFALEAVLEHIDAQRVDAIVNLGDHLSGPIDPAGTADLLMRRNLPSIRGNHDRWLIEQDPTDMGRTDRDTLALLRPEHMDWLRLLPASLVFGEEVLLSHGTPQSDESYWLEHITAGGPVALRKLEVIARAAEGYEYPVLLCGHTHTQRMIRLPDGRMILNPGAVGCPAYTDPHPEPHMVETGAPDARYAIIEKSAGYWSAEMYAVPYDFSAAAARAREFGREDWAAVLATGWVR